MSEVLQDIIGLISKLPHSDFKYFASHLSILLAMVLHFGSRNEEMVTAVRLLAGTRKDGSGSIDSLLFAKQK